MTLRRNHLALLCIAILASVAARAESLTLDQCVASALKNNPDIATADFEIDAATAMKNKAIGSYGPRVKLEAGVQIWDRSMPFDLGPLNAFLLTNGITLPNLRDQVTWSFGATIAQPLGALWTIHEGYALTKLGVDVAKIEREVSQRNVAFKVTEAYYRVLQAKRMAEIAQKSVEQVDAQVHKAQTFLDRGAVARNDVLRAKLGLATAQQRSIQTKGNVFLATSRLATLMGGPAGLDIDPVDQGEGVSTKAPPSTTEAEERAIRDRAELREVGLRTEQARAGVSLAKSKMLPQINLVGNYTHTVGQMFALDNAGFIGATASWDIWEGGGTYYGIDEAKARVSQALSARRKAEDMIRLDVRSAHIGVTTAAEALEVAKQAVEQAEENFRIEVKRYESTSNTSFDVLDAETQLTTARGQNQAAIYDYIIAQSNLARAMGEKHPAEMHALRESQNSPTTEGASHLH
jgi:outer membrane protein TolC